MLVGGRLALGGPGGGFRSRGWQAALCTPGVKEAGLGRTELVVCEQPGLVKRHELPELRDEIRLSPGGRERGRLMLTKEIWSSSSIAGGWW